ncbi:hypothetical protein SDC9_173222 [bioreactor metagenome]|uniref:Uncharacterized protein n=1 Tax=bioreactor metagenome TaxID=1076179 RepID=A0A645GHY9_9ZZZZ
MADEAPVLSKPPVRICCLAGAEDVVDDHGQDRHIIAAHCLGQGGVDRGVLQRRQWPGEHGFGQCPDEVAAAGCDGGGPLRIVHSCGPVSLIQGVEPGRQPVTEDDRSAADGLGDGGVFTFRVSGHIDTAPEWERAGIETLGE